MRHRILYAKSNQLNCLDALALHLNHVKFDVLTELKLIDPHFVLGKCENRLPMCVELAKRGMCQTHPGAMSMLCWRSCSGCGMSPLILADRLIDTLYTLAPLSNTKHSVQGARCSFAYSLLPCMRAFLTMNRCMEVVNVEEVLYSGRKIED